MQHKPPLSDELDVNALVRIFDDTTNSYKYLFFRALLDCIQIGNQSQELSEKIPLSRLIKGMLINAWYPHEVFKLNFGKQDKISEMLNKIPKKIAEEIADTSAKDKASLYQLNIGDECKELSRYVPFLLLRPFIRERIQSNQPERKIVELVNSLANDKSCMPPLYNFDSDNYNDVTHILIEKKWLCYLRTNFSIIEAWFSWNWFLYMKRRNPYTPELQMKIFRPSKRESLNTQTRLWREVLSNTSEDKKYKCIYSGKDLTESEFSLDHFLPWSFIGLDDLWNLIPTLKGTNSSKSNKLPNSYINDFIRFQFECLIFVNKNLPEIFEKFFEPYALSLSISKELIAKEHAESFSEAYKAVLDPLFLLARNQGFQDDWRYKESGE